MLLITDSPLVNIQKIQNPLPPKVSLAQRLESKALKFKPIQISTTTKHTTTRQFNINSSNNNYGNTYPTFKLKTTRSVRARNGPVYLIGNGAAFRPATCRVHRKHAKVSSTTFHQFFFYSAKHTYTYISHLFIVVIPPTFKTCQ